MNLQKVLWEMIANLPPIAGHFIYDKIIHFSIH